MRTTIRLDEHLLAQAKQLAASTGRTLTAVIEDALRAALVQSQRTRRGGRIELPSFGEGGLQPGIDLDDSAALLQVMDRSDDPA